MTRESRHLGMRGACALSAFKGRLTLSPGRTAIVEVQPGQVAWGKAQSHIGENIGETETHVLIIELKPA